MFGGQHRVDEVTRTEPVGWTGKKQPENCGAALAREGTGAAQLWGVCAKGIKKELNTLDEPDFVRDVENREKRISRHLSGLDGRSSPGFHDTHHVCAIAGLFHEVDATQQILESSV